MAKRHYGSGGYESMSMRLSTEQHDAGMIRENHSAIANLPQEVMIKPWPTIGNPMNMTLDDGITGVDAREKKENSKRSSYTDPRKA
jgi:hypothetical protein